MPWRRQDTDSSSSTSRPPDYAPPSRRDLRRERKALLLVREERLRDLGGLALEMYKRDRFNAELVVDRCAELVGIEARVQEIDSLLDGRLHAGEANTCVCGAPLVLGARYCASCGRPAATPRRVLPESEEAA